MNSRPLPSAASPALAPAGPSLAAGWPVGLLAWALAGAVLAVRLGLFRYAGSPLPYFDQWFAEFENGFMSVARGEPLLATLFRPHNEHLLVTTKLVSFAGFFLNGYWDVKFLAVASAVVRAAEAALVFRLLLPSTAGRAARLALWAGCAAVFVLPLSGFNILCGLQVSFYLAELALLGAIATVLRWQGGVRDVVALVVIQCLGLASFGSALAIPAATLAVHWLGARRRPRFWLAWGTTLALCAGYALLAAANAASSHAFRPWFFLEMLSWPLLSAPLGALVLALLAGLAGWRRHPAVPAAEAAAFGLLVFAVGNALLLAASRTPEMLHQRHWETLAWIPLGLGTVATLRWGGGPHRAIVRPVLIAWGALCLLFVAVPIRYEIWPYIAGAHAHRPLAEARLRRLLLARTIEQDAARLQRPLARKDYLFFDDPLDRYMMHPAVAHNYQVAPLPALAVLSPEVVPLRPATRLTWLTNQAVHFGWLLIFPAAALGVLGCAARPQRPAANGEAPQPAQQA